MTDIKKWMKLMENVDATFADRLSGNKNFTENDTIKVGHNVGGGVGRFVEYTTNGAMIDIKGILRELSLDDFSELARDGETGNDWFHSSALDDTIGTMNDKPEFRAGDIIKVADVYGAVIGPGFGVFIAYSTDGKECIVSFDSKEILVPIANVSAVVEQNAKDNFDEIDNDGNLSPMSLGSSNVRIEDKQMDHRDEFSKWIATVESSLSGKSIVDEDLLEQGACGGCGAWDCPVCFPEQDQDAQEVKAIIIMPDSASGQPQTIPDFSMYQQEPEPEQLPVAPQQDGIGMAGTKPVNCPTCGHSHEAGDSHEDEIEIPFIATEDHYEIPDDNTFEYPDEEIDTTPRNGSGKKLGHIVQKFVKADAAGQESPLTNTVELEEDVADVDSGSIVQKIVYMQDLGLSKAPVHYSEQDLMGLAQTNPGKLKSLHDQVMGDATAAPADTNTPTQPQMQPEATPQEMPDEQPQMETRMLHRGPTLFEMIKWDEEISEAFIAESSLSKLIGKQKGGQQLVKWLHSKHKLGNDADLSPAPFSERMMWKEYKRNPDNFIIVSASDGVAGIKPYEKQLRAKQAAAKKKGKDYDPGGDSTLQYQVIAFTDDGQQVDPSLLRPAPQDGDEREIDPTVMKARMGKISGKDTQNPDNIFNLLAGQIGSLNTVYVANAGVERDKMAGRDANKPKQMGEDDAINTIFKKIKPVLSTLASQATKHAAGDPQKTEKLNAFISSIDGGITPQLANQLKMALADAASAPINSREYVDFLNTAATGNSAALKPVLDSLRKSLTNI